MKVTRYEAAQKKVWDEFIQRSKNGTFLFLRDYMDYHCDRFHDHSLLVWDGKDRLLAVLPAHANDKTLSSHDGLTYGGFITDDNMKALKMRGIVQTAGATSVPRC